MKPARTLLLLPLLLGCPPQHAGGAGVVNHRNAPLAYTARTARLDCLTFSSELGRALTQADFEPPLQEELAPESWQQLDYQSCGAAWVTIGDVFDRVVLWNDLTADISEGAAIDRRVLRRSITVEGTRERLRVTVGQALEALPPPAEGPPTLPWKQSDAGE